MNILLDNRKFINLKEDRVFTVKLLQLIKCKTLFIKSHIWIIKGQLICCIKFSVISVYPVYNCIIFRPLPLGMAAPSKVAFL